MNHLYMDNDIFKKVTGRQKLQILYNTKNTIKIFLCIAVMSQISFFWHYGNMNWEVNVLNCHENSQYKNDLSG